MSELAATLRFELLIALGWANLLAVLVRAATAPARLIVAMPWRAPFGRRIAGATPRTTSTPAARAMRSARGGTVTWRAAAAEWQRGIARLRELRTRSSTRRRAAVRRPNRGETRLVENLARWRRPDAVGTHALRSLSVTADRGSAAAGAA